MATHKFIGVIVAGLLFGCASTDAEPTSRLRDARDAQQADQLEAPAPRRGKMLGGERVRRIVEWPDDAAIDDVIRGELSEAALASIDGLPLPVLVSSRPSYAQVTEVMKGEHWYATLAKVDGLTVTLNASGEARVYPHIKPFSGNERVHDQEAFVTQNETIWSVTWIEHGVSYDLGLECESPTMPQCQDGAYVLELAEDLVFVGPQEDAR